MTSDSVAERPIGRMIESLSPCVIDIGARGGADEETLAIAWASGMVCFEPAAAEAQRLSQAGDSRWRDFKVLPFAVGSVSGTDTLHVPESPQAASLLPHNPSMVERFGRENLHVVRETFPVRTWTLDDLRLGGHISRVDYLKIDVEGAELGILTAGGSVLNDCVALKVEGSFLPQRIRQPLVWEIANLLIGAGFEVVEIHDIHRWRRRNLPAHPYRIRFAMPYSRGQVAQCDLVLLRAQEHLHGDDQALRLVILAAALGYFDYAISVIRSNADMTRRVRREFGFDLEVELVRWSAITGKREVKRAIAAGIRGLVPLVRALVGRLPYPRGGLPY
jgi:FkbM family methyltransferase